MEPFDAGRDYYTIIGAGEGASQREIERLYKQRAQKLHPDRGGSEEEMKALNEAYRVLRDEQTRSDYDSYRRSSVKEDLTIHVTPAAREVGVYGQSLSALLCLMLGLMLLFLVRFNGLWFLWPLAILALGVILFGVLIAHSAVTNARASLGPAHPLRRFRPGQEIAFWLIVCGGGYTVYLILTSL